MKQKFVEIVMAYPGGCTYQINEKENYILYPSMIMRKKGFTPEIWTLLRPGLKRQQFVKGVKVRRFKNTFSLLFSLLISRDVKLIHSFLRPFVPSLLSGLIFNKRKILVPVTYELGSTKLIQKISVFLMKRFDKILALTPYERDIYLKKNIPKKKVELLPLCIDYEFFSKKINLNLEEIKKKYSIKNNDFVIISIANFRKFKNLDIMLQAFKIFHSKVKNSKFIVVGKDMLKSDIYKEQKKQKGSSSIKEIVSNLDLQNEVVITGPLNSSGVRELLKISDIFVNSSYPEAQGIAVYEAAASGLPLCLSNIGSFTSVFGDFALYNNPKDARKLAENYMVYYKNKSVRNKNSKYLKKLMKEWDYKLSEIKFNQIFDELLIKKVN